MDAERDHDDRAPRRVAAAPVPRRRVAARGSALAARGPQARARAIPRGAARDRGAARWPGSDVRRPRPALRNRLQRMGSEMVRGATAAVARRDEGGLSEPTFLGILMTGLPGFLREGFLPLGAFYAGLRLDGLAAGIVASAAASLVVYLYERRAGRDALLVRVSLAFVAVDRKSVV